jgi:signal transduction histidine kinase
VVLGVILLGVVSNSFERSKYEMMERFVDQAAKVTAENYAENKPYLNSSLLSMTYSVVSITIQADVFLVDTDGRILFHANNDAAGDEEVTLSEKTVADGIVQSAITTGRYETTGNLQGFFASPQYVVGIPVIADGKPFGAVFAASSADELLTFMTDMVKMFVISGLLVLAVVSVIIYFITARMVEPLYSMLDATHSFSRGDFSKRVPVNGYDEVGKLSMAFNNMASTLAVTESTRRSFIANVSHELKTPMTTISGFVDGVLDGTVPEEKRDQYLAIVSTECKRLSRLVRSMLDMARLEAGELELNPVTLDISEIIRQTVFTFEHAIEEKELDVRGLETDRVMVLADKDLIHQVVYNLVDNAVKFVNPGGYREFLYRSEQGMTFVTIRNSGEGIEKSEAPQLFERFYKSDRSRSLDKDGVGLGLHIVKSIVHYHKGDISVQSLQGEYTDFEFSLPNP